MLLLRHSYNHYRNGSTTDSRLASITRRRPVLQVRTPPRSVPPETEGWGLDWSHVVTRTPPGRHPEPGPAPSVSVPSSLLLMSESPSRSVLFVYPSRSVLFIFAFSSPSLIPPVTSFESSLAVTSSPRSRRFIHRTFTCSWDVRLAPVGLVSGVHRLFRPVTCTPPCCLLHDVCLTHS